MQNVFKEARLRAGFTQQQLADTVGVHVLTIQRIEKEPWRLEKLSLGTAKKVGQACNLDPMKLI